MAMIQPIESGRIVLREYRSDDLASALHFTNDPEAATHSTWGPLNEQETSAWLDAVMATRNTEPRLSFSFALVVKDSQELIGNITLNIRNAATREAELGYTLRRDYWHQGYATEAARALIHFGFSELDLHRIFATTSPQNAASQKVLEKLGFTREGYLRKNVLQRGQWRDSCLYAVLQDEWT